LGAALIATETNDLAGEAINASAQLTSPNCKGIEKVRRLEAWLGQQGEKSPERQGGKAKN
jgi:hypothetical protein